MNQKNGKNVVLSTKKNLTKKTGKSSLRSNMNHRNNSGGKTSRRSTGSSGGGYGGEILLSLLINVAIPLLSPLVEKIAIGIGERIARSKVAPETSEDTVSSVEERFVRKHCSNSNETPTPKNEVNINRQPFLLFGKLIHQLEVVVIYAVAGIGKTFLAIYLAIKAAHLKVAYYGFDDIGNNQSLRTNGISNIEYFCCDRLEELLAELKDYAKGICERRAFWDRMFKEPAQIQRLIKQTMQEMGIHESKKIDNVLLLELLVKTMCYDYDIIVLDESSRE